MAIKWTYGWRLPLVQGVIFGARQANRGDLVVFLSPLHRTRPWIMRVIGLPNETIEIRDWKVLVNGKPLDEPYARFLVSDDHRGGSLESFLEAQSSSDPRLASLLRELKAGSLSDPSLTSVLRSPDNWGPAPVPPDSYFVLGDNRDNSRDSRFWGFVPEDDLLARATVIYWSSDPREGRIRWERIGCRLQ